MLCKVKSRVGEQSARLLAAHVARDAAGPLSKAATRRAYTAPSSSSHAPATAQAMRRRDAAPSSSASVSVAQGVFARKTPMVVLPTPLPADTSSVEDSFYFPKSNYQETLNIIDACMFRGHDMPRARTLLDGLRAQVDGRSVGNVDVSVYNQFIVTYLDLASLREEASNRETWVRSAWEMWDLMLDDGVEPDYTTYAAMLLLCARFEPSAPRGLLQTTHTLTPSQLLTKLHSTSPRLLAPSSSSIDSRLAVPRTIERVLAYFDVAKPERDFLLGSVQQWAAVEGHTDVLLEMGEMDLFKIPEGEEGSVEGLEGWSWGGTDGEIPLVTPVQKKDMGSMPWQNRKKSSSPSDTATSPEDPTSPFNLTSLRTSLSSLIASRPHLLSDPLSRQKLLEASAVEDAKERLQHEFERLEAQGLGNVPALKGRKSIRTWMWEWFGALTTRVEEEVKAIVAAEEKTREKILRGEKITERERLTLAPFLTLLKPHQLALITIMEVLRLHGSGGVSEGMKTARALISVGMAVEQEYNAALRKREMGRRGNLEKFYKAEADAESSASSSALDAESADGVSASTSSAVATPDASGDGLASVNARRAAAKRDAEVESASAPEWSRAIQAKVGSMLVDALMDTATVVRTVEHPETGEEYSERQPAFNHEYEYQRGKKLGVIKLNPEVAHEFTKGGSSATLHPRHLPMFVPPRPWVNHNSGAYFYNRSNVMRIKDSLEQAQYLAQASAAGNLELIYSGLDVLGSTPWVINKPVFKVVLETWNSGAGLADIPPADLDLPDPVKPDDYDTNDLSRKEYLMQLKETINKRRNNHSDRCSVNYKLEIARAFLPDKFYFPHNLDFRGRAYPIPPHLNHIGNDLSRGLLKFADKQPLGVSGLRWLKIHLANVYGFDKASFDEREEWTMNKLEEIRDSAERPLEGKRWWVGADDPWQCLATSMELTEALKLEDPTTFESNLPVHQDGTCNGLQHYAALGGDSVGAQQVNLDVTERPSDVYTYVANMVDEQIEVDIKKGNKIAVLLRGRVARKTVKQTVMTTVYGVTFIGARAQIEKQLRSVGDLSRDELWACSTYLARATLSCITDLFSGAKAIQTWLSVVARLIAKSIPSDRVAAARDTPHPALGDGKGANSFSTSRAATEQMTSVIWTTPMGLPIVQPYRKIKRKQLITPVQSVYIGDPNLQTQVNPNKQSSAFPPNFIHSLDATHMMLTALECRKAELTFASVHDSYWTHACTVDKMSSIIRDTFVHLHSSDIMGRLLAEVQERYQGYEIPVLSLNEREVELINSTTQTKIEVKGRGTRGAKTLKPLAGTILSKSGEADAEELMTELDGPALDPSAEVVVHSQSGSAEDSLASAVEADAPKRRKPATKTFVKLIDVLPPLPAKGTFSVETIKKSLYFFS